MRKTTTYLLAAFLLSGTGAIWAQNFQPIHVPLSDPSKPARIHMHLLMGSITVRGVADSKEVVVEAGRAHPRDHDDMPEPPEPPEPPERGQHPVPPGMHRLDLNGSGGLDIKEDHNNIEIKSSAWMRNADITLLVPRHSSLELKSVTNGGIEVDQVDGELDVEALNGRISLNDVSGAVVAHSLNGEIVAKLDHVDPSKPMSFSTLNGVIDVSLPESVKANVRLKTDNGAIYSDFDVRMEGAPQIVDNSTDGHGSHHYRMDRTLRGTINGGGPEYTFTSFNGTIYIRKRK